MGINFGMSSCGSDICATSNNLNPNPKRFKILEAGCNKDFTILRVKYDDCTNYEGTKILVYEGHVLDMLIKAQEIDPHFCENHLSPIARFAPTELGLSLALNLKR